jgi:hypothetical protein
MYTRITINHRLRRLPGSGCWNGRFTRKCWVRETGDELHLDGGAPPFSPKSGRTDYRLLEAVNTCPLAGSSFGRIRQYYRERTGALK